MTRGEDQTQQMELQSPNPTMEIWIVDGRRCVQEAHIPLRRVDTYKVWRVMSTLSTL